MRFPKHLYIYFVALISFFSLFSQQESRDYDFIWHSADDNSLPQNSVKSIIKDKFGFLWLSTENGLVRYDGNKFKVFNIENLKGLRTNRISYFRGNATTDSIHVLSDFADLILIKNNRPTVIPKNKIPELFRIKNLVHEGKRFYINKIYKSDNSYYKLESGSIVAFTKDNLRLWEIKYDFEDQTQFFILDDVLYSHKNGKFVRFENQKMYFATIEGLPTTGFDIYSNHVAQQTFFTINNTVYLLEKNQGKLGLKPLLTNFDISKNNIISYYYDAQNEILYLGSSTNGLLIVKKKKFTSILGNNRNGVYYAQIPYGKNRFLTTSGEVFSEKGSEEKRIFQTDSDNYMLLKDRQGNLWTKTDDIVCRLNKDTNFLTSDKWSFEDRVIQLFETKKGEILVGIAIGGSPDGKIYKLDATDSEKKPSFKFYMDLYFNPTYMVEIEDNVIWTGSHIGFHKIYFKEKKIEDIKDISNTYVRSVYIAKPDEIWVTTYEKGFFLYNQFTKKTTHFPIDKNRYLLSSHCILDDQNGYLWISTNKGLFQASKKNLLDYSQKKISQVYYQYYDKSDGFYTNEFNGGCQPCGLRLENNSISFPSMRGNVIFSPKKIKLLLPEDEIYFQEAEIDSRIQEINNDSLFLKNDFGRVKLFINSPYYGNPNNQNIEIRLQGPISQKWTSLKGDDISYTSLPYGTYYLTARKLTGFDSVYKYKVLTIIVPPAFYETIWFKTLLIISGLLLIFYTIKMRIRYIRRKNILLEKKIAEQTFQLRSTISTLRKTKENLSEEIINHKKLIGTITHDIKSPLRFLALTGKHAYQNIDDKETITDDLRSIYTSSFQLYNFVDNLLEYTKVSKQENASEPHNLYGLAAEKIEIFLNIASSKKIEIANRIEPMTTLITNKLLLSIIIHNLLDNAIKNTINGTISFTSGRKDESIFIKIKDTGKGMPAEVVDFYNNPRSAKTQEDAKKTGMGLPMIAELLIILNGSMEIKSYPNQGTEITITLQEEKSS